MANAKSRSVGPALSTAEQTAGFCYLPFYVVLLAQLLRWLSGLLGLELTEVQINAAYFVINCAIIWIIFHGFLIRSFRSIRFWELVQAVILGFCLYYGGNWLMGWLLSALEIAAPAINDETVSALISQNRLIMGICAVVLAPIVEETLVRGLLFGVIRPKSRIAAYVVTVLFFAFIHVWQYVPIYGFGMVLTAGLRYIPAGIALGWTYEKSNTIWAPILLHMSINAISMGVVNMLQ